MTTEKTGAERVAELLKHVKITSTDRDKIIDSLYFDKDGFLASFYSEPLLNLMTVKEYDDFLQKAGANWRVLSPRAYGYIWNRQTQTCDLYPGGECHTGGCI